VSQKSRSAGGPEWRDEWARVLEAAKLRPAMFIGGTKAGHWYAVREPLRLVWQAYAVREPLSASVHLSPTQYLVRCFAGPLVRPIQRMFKFGDTPVLGGGWAEPLGRIRSDRSRRITGAQSPLRGWRDRFGSATGPLLDSPMMPRYLARRFAIGYRVDGGMWCQTFESGWPCSAPALVTDDSPVGMIAAGELDSQWFTGLPFGLDEVAKLDAMEHVSVEWHDRDDILPDGTLSVDTVRGWI
jgi:hypothetical protein